MAIMSDKWIRTQAKENGMISPFVEAQKRDGCISYGLSSYGYDARVSDEFKIFTNVDRSEEHTSELQSLMRISYAVFCLKTKTRQSQYSQNKHKISNTITLQ